MPLYSLFDIIITEIDGGWPELLILEMARNDGDRSEGDEQPSKLDPNDSGGELS